MIKVLKKIWNFSKEEQANIRKSIIFGLLHSIFNAIQFGAIYYMLVAILHNTVSMQTIWVCLGILFVSLVGQVLTQKVSQMDQTHAGYFMSANKRIEIGEKIKKYQWGFSQVIALED